MAKPNYSFEKRQRELAKKKKKEEKLQEKAARKGGPAPGDEGATVDGGGADTQSAFPPSQEPVKP